MLHVGQQLERQAQGPQECLEKEHYNGNGGPPEHGFIILYIVHGEQLVDLQRTCQVSVNSGGYQGPSHLRTSALCR